MWLSYDDVNIMLFFCDELLYFCQGSYYTRTKNYEMFVLSKCHVNWWIY